MKKGYKQTEIGVIPEDWEVIALKSIGQWKGGATPSMNNPVYWVNGNIPWASSGDIKSIEIGETPYKITDIAIEQTSTTLIPENAIIIVVRSGILRKYLPVAKTKKSVAINQDLKAVIPDKNYSVDYLLQILLLSSYKILSTCLKSGTTVESVEYSWLKDFKIPSPPLTEQKAIAAALSDADSLITILEKLIEKKRNIKQGTMQELLTGKRRLPGFTGEWEKKKLGDIFNFSGGYTASREQLSGEGFCYLHYGDIHGAKKTYIDVQEEFVNIPKLAVKINQVSAKSLLNDGDIVFVDASEDDEGTSRHVVVKNNNKTPFISGLHTIVAKSIDDTLDNEFKRYCFQSEAIRRQFIFYAVGIKVSGISKKNIAKILLSVPAKSEQTAIASILSDMDAEIEALEKKLNKYRSIKQGMMQVLLMGKIRLVG